MAGKSNLDLYYNSIRAFFDTYPIKAFLPKTLIDLLNKYKGAWGIPLRKKAQSIIEFLEKKGDVHPSLFYDENNHIKVIYSWKNSGDLTIIQGLKAKSYYTHYTAMFLHQLSLQIPKVYYLNFEHANPKEVATITLTQENIDTAFSKPQRRPKHSFTFNSNRIFILNGKYTARLGVIKRVSENDNYEYTDLERTLIDIAIRPVYSGGVFEVLEAYKNAKENMDVKKLYTYLKELDFIYPYNQIIGFYLDKAGYPQNNLELFEQNINLKFYLTYDIRNKDYSERWHLYFPKGL